MTWKIGMTQQIKDDVVVIDGKDEFEHVAQTTPANATATASLGHLNLSAFYRS